MKLLALLLAFVLIAGSASALSLDNLYADTMIVDELDFENDLAFLVDCFGNLWAIEEVEDWLVGDIVSLIMFDQGTPDIYDDEIVYYRYSGRIEDWR